MSLACIPLANQHASFVDMVRWERVPELVVPRVAVYWINSLRGHSLVLAILAMRTGSNVVLVHMKQQLCMFELKISLVNQRT